MDYEQLFVLKIERVVVSLMFWSRLVPIHCVIDVTSDQHLYSPGGPVKEEETKKFAVHTGHREVLRMTGRKKCSDCQSIVANNY